MLVFWLGDVDWIDQDFGVVHCTPADQTAVITESRELVLLDVTVHRLLYVEGVVGHLLCETDKLNILFKVIADMKIHIYTIREVDLTLSTKELRLSC